MLILANARKQIKYLRLAYDGSAHDYAILKNELPPENSLWFDDHSIHVDLGFQGICKDYIGEHFNIPFKKSKNKPLTDEHETLKKMDSDVIQHKYVVIMIRDMNIFGLFINIR